MSVAAVSTLTIALVGNPNTGKSTLFNALAGMQQRVGNYPGCTVEEKIGHLEHDGRRFTLIDLPGTYSLAPKSPDEMITVDVLLGRRGDTPSPDAILCIVDASNLERNLYLVSQVLELRRPVVIALNMIDLAREALVELDLELIRKRVGVPIVPVQANTGEGLAELKTALARAAESHKALETSPFPSEFQQEVAALEELVPAEHRAKLPRFLVERLLLDTSGYLSEAALPGIDTNYRAAIEAGRQRLAEAGLPVPAVEAMARYGWVAEVLQDAVQRPSVRPITWTDRIDAVLTHRWAGTLVFLLLMALVFQAVFVGATPFSDAIDNGVSAVGDWVGSSMPPGALQSLLVTGVIGGVGGVLVFLPQICILFLFIALLEDCGYMARAAYLMDRLMSHIGLSGKSFIPLLSSFACAIPGIMATRVIENPRDRLVTILVAPLMSCSARLPVYALLIGAFIPGVAYVSLFGWDLITLPGLVMFAMYLIGIVTSILVAFVLKATILPGETPPFVMELPTYKWPSLAGVVYRVAERAWSFCARAGTLILAVSVIVWALSYFPRDGAAVEQPFASRQSELDAVEAKLAAVPAGERNAAHAQELAALEEQRRELENEIDAAYLQQSYLGQMGQFIEPVVRPLGWDWRIGCAAIASFPAREVVVGTLGVIYQLGEVDEESESLREKLKSATWDGTDRKVFNVPVALSILVFFALCAQCAATLAVIYRETNSWGWPLFTFAYMTTLAYLGALATYQLGSLLLGT